MKCPSKSLCFLEWSDNSLVLIPWLNSQKQLMSLWKNNNMITSIAAAWYTSCLHINRRRPGLSERTHQLPPAEHIISASQHYSWPWHWVFAGAVILVLVLTLVFCHAIILFTFGMSNLVFWILTCCQCPFPCQQYRGKLKSVTFMAKE